MFFRRPSSGSASPRAGYRLLSDQPYLGDPQQVNPDDPLGHHRIAHDLAALLLRSSSSSPLVLSIDAGWGMGKSTIMARVRQILEQHVHVRTVWFNTWTSGGDDVLEGLIKSALLQLDTNSIRRGLRRLQERRPFIGTLRLRSCSCRARSESALS